jgi:type IV secretory pathway VirD2 relaxase
VPPVGRSAALRQNATNNNILRGTRPIFDHADTLMNSPDDDLRIRLGRIRNRGTRIRPKSFVGEVLKAAHKAGYVGRRTTSARGRLRPSTFGRGRGTAIARARLFDPSRRVIVKARVVRHRSRTFHAAPLATHVAYLRREGVTRDGEKARMFDATSDRTDEKAFAARCEGDRHHFRFVVSPEDPGDMTDLKAFARDLVADMERDLGSRLDWIGVDHWNTDNPHVHLLIRGKTDDGRDLVISRDYISRGIRARAEELITIELGPRSEHEVRSALEREVDADRWTRLDATIRRQADESGVIDLRLSDSGESHSETRRLLIGRLQRLERMGLASSAGPAQWVVAAEAEATLRDLGVRGDIIKTMHRAMTERGIDRALGDYAIHDPRGVPSIIGRLMDKGLHDELAGEAYVVIDGVDGRAHYVRFTDIRAIEHAPPVGGSIVEIRHLEGEGRDRPLIVLAMRSDLTLEAQVTASGATWLDHQLLVRNPATLSEAGFGREVRQALDARIEHLVGDGLARRQAQRVIFARDLLATLRRRELNDAGTRIAAETGLACQTFAEGDSVTGVYARRVTLASGRFAMIDDGLGFRLVPWQPALERHLGRQVSGVADAGGRIAWTFGRRRGLGL